MTDCSRWSASACRTRPVSAWFLASRSAFQHRIDPTPPPPPPPPYVWVKTQSARCLRRTGFGQDIAHHQALPKRDELQFLNLGIDREDLAVVGLGGFSGVDDVGGHAR